jgi:hypothetical protein
VDHNALLQKTILPGTGFLMIVFFCLMLIGSPGNSGITGSDFHMDDFTTGSSRLFAEIDNYTGKNHNRNIRNVRKCLLFNACPQSNQ